jgi:FkbM family methyltransferase
MTSSYVPKQVLEDRRAISIENVTLYPIDHAIPDYMRINIKETKPILEDIMVSPCKFSNEFYTYRNDVIIGQSIRMYGEYTQVELDLLFQYLNSDCIVYDIGANIGYHSLGFSTKVKHVYCFEPNSKNYKLLELNTKHRPNVSLCKTAVSDKAGKLHIQDFDVSKPGNYGEMLMSESGEECDVVRIDDLNLPYPHLIKIDVEGHELKVFNGSKNTIRKHTPIIFYEAMHGSGFDEIYDFLHDELKYNLYWIGVSNYNPRNHNKVNYNIFGNGGVINILALPKQYPVDPYLEKVQDRTDTHIKFIERITKRFQNA